MKYFLIIILLGLTGCASNSSKIKELELQLEILKEKNKNFNTDNSSQSSSSDKLIEKEQSDDTQVVENTSSKLILPKSNRSIKRTKETKILLGKKDNFTYYFIYDKNGFFSLDIFPKNKFYNKENTDLSMVILNKNKSPDTLNFLNIGNNFFISKSDPLSGKNDIEIFLKRKQSKKIIFKFEVKE